MDKLQINNLIKTFELCKTVIQLLHPHLDPTEPCIAFEAYEEVSYQISKLRHLTSQSSGQETPDEIWTNEDEAAEIERQIVEDVSCR